MATSSSPLITSGLSAQPSLHWESASIWWRRWWWWSRWQWWWSTAASPANYVEQPFKSVCLDSCEKPSHGATLAETNHHPVTKYMFYFSQEDDGVVMAVIVLLRAHRWPRTVRPSQKQITTLFENILDLDKNHSTRNWHLFLFHLLITIITPILIINNKNTFINIIIMPGIGVALQRPQRSVKHWVFVWYVLWNLQNKELVRNWFFIFRFTFWIILIY